MATHQIKKYALVRGIPNTFPQCISTYRDASEMDVALARKQHKAYCGALTKLGLEVISIPADNALPDCCFTEDTAVIVDDVALITIPGAPSRKGETDATENALKIPLEIQKMKMPATLDGGDVLQIGKTFYVGISSRTNVQGIGQLATLAKKKGYDIMPVPLRGTLHLKTVCTSPGNGFVLYAPGYFDESIFSHYKKIKVSEEETTAANCLAVNGTVLIASGFPHTKSLLEEKGFTTRTLDMSEIEKADGGLTCLSVIF